MPTYDYRCKSCKHEFEHVQSMSSPLLKKCPACKKAALERLIGTGAALIFKGGGFYETDYRSDSYKKAAEADSKPAESTKSESKSETKTETKSEAKSETKSETKTESKAEAKPAKTEKPKTKSKKEDK